MTVKLLPFPSELKEYLHEVATLYADKEVEGLRDSNQEQMRLAANPFKGNSEIIPQEDIDNYIYRKRENEYNRATERLTWEIISKCDLEETIKYEGPIGYIYIFKDKHRAYKIGMTGNWRIRLKQHLIKFPNLKLLRIYETSWYEIAEKKLHYLFKAKRIPERTHEWFSLTPLDIKEIDRVMGKRRMALNDPSDVFAFAGLS